MMIKNLSKNVVKKNNNFHLRPDLDFADDGNRFRGFDYKGLPITTLRTEDRTWLSIRIDYIYRNKNFTYREWLATEESKLADEFNCGVSEFSLDKLIDNCEKILAKIDELEEFAKNDVIDIGVLKSHRVSEKWLCKDVIEEAKKDLQWWKLEIFDLKQIKNGICRLERTIERLENMDFEHMSRSQKKNYTEYIEEYGHMVIGENDYDIQKIRRFIKAQ